LHKCDPYSQWNGKYFLGNGRDGRWYTAIQGVKWVKGVKWYDCLRKLYTNYQNYIPLTFWLQNYLKLQLIIDTHITFEMKGLE
jgi:hypothetical protein